ncbi:MAG: undecaprenyldiphospho-muramoylpentapeptide beta-N-acetylglucosaminyltransferase [Acidobacteriota bacterium]
MTAPSRLAVVIAGGGTGGHLYPGIAVARELMRRLPAARLTFAGTARGLEARVVPREGFELDLIRSAGLKGKSAVARLRGALLLVPSFLDSWRIISRRKPAVVIGVGGYSSGPVILTAALRGVPTMVLEQNARPGLTNRLLARVVRAAAVTYAQTLQSFGTRGFVSGNPVRAEFFATSPRAEAALPRVLILGGSQGAHALNLVAPAAFALLSRQGVGVDVVHQTGERDVTDVRNAYGGEGLLARVEAFLDPVVTEVLAADLVLCRAGATTLAELAAASKPAVLVPLPTATDDHQRKNARVLADAGAAVVIDQRDLSAAVLAAALQPLLEDRAVLDRMAHAINAFARPDAAGVIVDRALELAGWAPTPAARMVQS